MAKSYTGVYYNRLLKKYQSKVGYGGVSYNCGVHDTAEGAARARDRKIIEKGLKVQLQIFKSINKKA